MDMCFLANHSFVAALFRNMKKKFSCAHPSHPSSVAISQFPAIVSVVLLQNILFAYFETGNLNGLLLCLF